MNRKIGLTFGFSVIFLCAIVLSLIYVRSSLAHYNTKRVTEIVETCYLIGYPRTKCGEKKFKETEFTVSGADHLLVLDDNNEVRLAHKPGRANHAQRELPGKRKSRTKSVYSGCADC